jgi:hypothetical protein
MHTNRNELQPSAVRTILLACLVAGTLDISYAIITWGPVFGSNTATHLLQGIAGTLMGPRAFTGGSATALIGLTMHFGISLAWTTIFFFTYPRLPLLSRNKWIGGFLYGIFVWAMMTLLIVPLITGRAWHYNTIPFLKSIAPIVLLFGPAIALIVGRHYSRVPVTLPAE